MDALEKCKNEKRLLCLPGQEVTGRVHILAIGINEMVNFPKDATKETDIKNVVEEIHRQGGLAIAAHPFNPEHHARFTEEELINSGFDAVECERASFSENQKLNALSKKYNLPCVYNSDTHELGMLRTVYTVCTQKIKSLNDLKEAIQGNKCHLFAPIDIIISGLVNLL